MPEDVSSYESMIISDELDIRLAIQETSTYINGEVADTYQVEVDEQNVSLELTREQLEELAGKEVQLHITVQVKEDVVVGEEIDNVAEVSFNGNSVMETNSVTVTPSNLESEKDEVTEEATKETVEDTSFEVNNVEASNVLEINDVDSYGISNNLLDRSFPQIRQFDGNNFRADPKAIVFITGIPGSVNIHNGLAIHD
ncbi:isopeptide-forming domain-containing fimbrial protein [Bacillus sp. JCM 19034]|uniref:isopeptide-forming domain-containing fimbrial protein n=1 Tax=Bacillus sp. JCM 19034 TaxID=1481928 RepID=UPI00078442BC|nr:isopeptide-forming domain-containing fimbrial protein [Bacillus sp. JCM 19034]